MTVITTQSIMTGFKGLGTAATKAFAAINPKP